MRFLPFSVLFTLAVSPLVIAHAGDALATGIAWIDCPDERRSVRRRAGSGYGTHAPRNRNPRLTPPSDRSCGTGKTW